LCPAKAPAEAGSSRAARSSAAATRLGEQVVGDAAQRGVQVPAQHVAQHRPQAAAQLADQLLDLGLRPHQARDRRALE
jgi:hypothetical protein